MFFCFFLDILKAVFYFHNVIYGVWDVLLGWKRVPWVPITPNMNQASYILAHKWKHVEHTKDYQTAFVNTSSSRGSYHRSRSNIARRRKNTIIFLVCMHHGGTIFKCD